MENICKQVKSSNICFENENKKSLQRKFALQNSEFEKQYMDEKKRKTQEQQEVLEKAGVPFFTVTTDPKMVDLQTKILMYIKKSKLSM